MFEQQHHPHRLSRLTQITVSHAIHCRSYLQLHYDKHVKRRQ
jgi:hypothetical protein